jgi:hypothetical protein
MNLGKKTVYKKVVFISIQLIVNTKNLGEMMISILQNIITMYEKTMVCLPWKAYQKIWIKN